MKILYIAKERRAAELAGFALPAVAPDVAVGWAADLDEARRWIDANRDVATIIVEVESDLQSYEPFIRQVQASGVTAPVVVVSVPGHASAFPALAAVADEIVPKDASFLNDLPGIVARALDGARPASRATARLTERQSAFDAQLAGASTSLRALERCLNDTAAAIEQARRDHAAEAVALSEQHEQRTSELANRVAEVTGLRQQLEQQIADQAVALQRAGDRAARVQQARTKELAEAAEAADEYWRHRRELEARIFEAAAARDAIERRVNDALSALEQARDDRAADAAAAATHLAMREAELMSRLESAAATEGQLEGRLADADAALRYMEQRVAADEVALHQQKAEWQTEIEAERARAAAARQMFEQQLAEQTLALRQSEARLVLEATEAERRLAEQQAQYEQRLTAAANSQELLQALLAAADVSLQDAERRAASDRRNAAGEAAELRATFEADLAQETTRRQVLEQALADTDKRLGESCATAAALEAMLADSTTAFRRFEQYHAAEISEAAARQTDYQKQSEARMAQASATLDVLKVKLAERQAKLDAELAREIANREALTSQLAQAGEAHQEDILRHASEISAATAARQRAEADSRAASEQAERRLVETVAAMRQRAREQEALVEDRAARTTQQLQEQLRALGEELAIDRRRFEQTPASIARCTRDGRIERANPALANLLGYDTPEALQTVDFATTVFESGDELQWLIDRCLASHSSESIETTWMKRDGSRIIVRVLASATTQDSIDLTAHDITALRSLEEKLRHSQRMEAVGRYASEVAQTCDTVLGNVKQEAQKLLAWPDGGAARPQADLMLEDVTRASVLLRRLALYGEKEKNAPALVDLHRVLRDLEPVLRRVAGNHIEFVLPKASTPHNLEVEAERVERILVNLAAYGRERMPLGGRLTLELAPAVVNRTFVEKYPNVRPGSHVLLTVTEKRSAVSDAHGAVPAVGTPGVDLGTLQALVSECRGHLWMTAEPSGDMVLKIHLPRRVLDAPEKVAPPRHSVLRAA